VQASPPPAPTRLVQIFLVDNNGIPSSRKWHRLQHEPDLQFITVRHGGYDTIARIVTD